MHNLKKIIGVLSISLVTGIATVITTIIPLLSLEFPDKSLASIEMLVTISNLSAIVTILFNERISTKLGLKKTILLGLSIACLFGMLPFFISNYFVILLSRVVLGFGIGLYSPHAISLISIFFEGTLRNNLLGVQMGIGALGNAILLMISSWLASIDWNYAFLTYFLLAGIFTLVWRFVPTIPFEKKELTKKKITIEKSAKSYIFLCFITFIIIWGVQLKIPSYLVERNILSTEKSGYLLSAMNIAGMFAGLSFGFLYKKFNVFLLPIGYIGGGLSVLCMISSTKWPTIFLFGILFNFLYSFTGPTITLKVNQVSSIDQITKVNSYLSLSTIMSAYIAPLVWNSMTVFKQDTTVTDTLKVITITLFLIGCILFCYFLIKRRR